ncbi:MAG TPA: glycoside hydrolase family 3 N-terminal domain-containing protein [Acidobacteriota bacterium]|nr:glycoside hydrolase family 3 N-terminal domain-containing protein [Acidobacteriota bacterium]
MRPARSVGLMMLLLFSAAVALAPARGDAMTAAAGDVPAPFRNPGLDPEARARDLLGRLTLEEKASFMVHETPGVARLGIPPYTWWNECLHGVARSGRATVFPQAIGLAATFDPDLIGRIGAAIAAEARAKHAARPAGAAGLYTGLTFWSPNVNIFRDPRWGRGQETYGEDPYLTGRLGAALVRGLQGDDPRRLMAAACAKHFAAGSGPEASRHRFDAAVTETDLRETYLPAFGALVAAGVEAVMCAYNRLDNEPCCASPFLLREVLRGEFGFRGHVVSDCGALRDFVDGHRTAADDLEAAVQALRAGVNLECGTAFRQLPSAVRQGRVTEAEVDAALLPLLRTLVRLGMFDPAPPPAPPPDVVGCAAHVALAREAAVKSMVLLQNRGGALPLPPDLRTLFVTGPAAASVDALLGNYHGLGADMVTVLEGITRRAGPGLRIEYSPGCPFDVPAAIGNIWPAGYADATVAVVGLTPDFEGEEGEAFRSGAAGDRTSLELPAIQVELIRRLRARSSRPLVVVLTGGSAVAIPEILELADAVLLAWYPGQEGGNAVADVLFGAANPAGRLPVTFYRTLADLPPFEDYRMDGRTYRYYRGEPAFPFGFGLSCTTFGYEGLAVAPAAIPPDGAAEVRLTVANTGAAAGDEVVQLYVEPPDARSGGPNQELKGFQRIRLTAGERRELRFTLSAAALRRWDAAGGRWTVRPGRYVVRAGGSSAGPRAEAALTITE